MANADKPRQPKLSASPRRPSWKGRLVLAYQPPNTSLHINPVVLSEMTHIHHQLKRSGWVTIWGRPRG